MVFLLMGINCFSKQTGSNFQAKQMNRLPFRNMIMIISVMCHSKNSLFIKTLGYIFCINSNIQVYVLPCAPFFNQTSKILFILLS